MANPWNEHVAKFRKSNPNMSFKEALKAASKTYKKGHKSKKPKEVEMSVDDYVK